MSTILDKKVDQSLQNHFGYILKPLIFEFETFLSVIMLYSDSCVFVEGHSFKDPLLTVDVSFELFVSKEDSDIFDFSFLFMLADDARNHVELLSHPLIKMFAHSNETKNILRRLLYIVMGVFLLLNYFQNIKYNARFSYLSKRIRKLMYQMSFVPGKFYAPVTKFSKFGVSVSSFCLAFVG